MTLQIKVLSDSGPAVHYRSQKFIEPLFNEPLFYPGVKAPLNQAKSLGTENMLSPPPQRHKYMHTNPLLDLRGVGLSVQVGFLLPQTLQNG